MATKKPTPFLYFFHIIPSLTGLNTKRNIDYVVSEYEAAVKKEKEDSILVKSHERNSRGSFYALVFC